LAALREGHQQRAAGLSAGGRREGNPEPMTRRNQQRQQRAAAGLCETSNRYQGPKQEEKTRRDRPGGEQCNKEASGTRLTQNLRDSEFMREKKERRKKEEERTGRGTSEVGLRSRGQALLSPAMGELATARRLMRLCATHDPSNFRAHLLR